MNRFSYIFSKNSQQQYQNIFKNNLKYSYITILKNKPKQITRFQAQNKYVQSHGDPKIQTYYQYFYIKSTDPNKFKQYFTKEQEQKLFKAHALGSQSLAAFQHFRLNPYIKKDDFQVMDDVDIEKQSLLKFLKNMFYIKGKNINNHNNQNSSQTSKKQKPEQGQGNNKKINLQTKDNNKNNKKLKSNNNIYTSQQNPQKSQSQVSLIQKFIFTPIEKIKYYIQLIKSIRLTSPAHQFVLSIFIFIISVTFMYFYFMHGQQYQLIMMNKIINTDDNDFYEIKNVVGSIGKFQKMMSIRQEQFYKRLRQATHKEKNEK